MILVKEETDARAAFGILFITGQPLCSIARRLARAEVAEQAAVLMSGCMAVVWGTATVSAAGVLKMWLRHLLQCQTSRAWA